MKIVVDSREQNSLKFKEGEAISKKLDVGDYSIEGMEHLISVERKNPLDLFRTLTSDNERFQRELKRASRLEYFAVMIEGSYRSIRDKTFNNSYRTKVRGDIILKILYNLSFKYNFHIIFCHDRNEASSMLR
ncbi:MAG TPA: ERCC4 domain-containing protein, partial [Methanosarcinales archaeon]|nr:ERCC4 domain-containing protein [Methanosarcinales archaeon]